MATEPKTGLTLWPAGALQQDLLFNALLKRFAAVGGQPSVLDKDLATPPGSPASGATYIVAATPTGAWAGKAGSLAYWNGVAWDFYTPTSSDRWQVFVVDESAAYRWSGSAWATASGAVSSVNGGSGAVVVLVPICIACSDETTALTAGTSKVTFRMPYGFTLTGVRASLTTAQSSGSIFTVDINEAGTTILSTKLTIDNTEKTSTSAATAAAISDPTLADDAEITIDIDQVGDGTAAGLKVWLVGYPL